MNIFYVIKYNSTLASKSKRNFERFHNPWCGYTTLHHATKYVHKHHAEAVSWEWETVVKVKRTMAGRWKIVR